MNIIKNSRPRVVITGMGIVSPLGNNINTFWKNLVKGQSGVAEISQFDPENSPCKLAAEVKNFHAEKLFDEDVIRLNPRYSLFGLLAAEEAVKHSKLPLKKNDNQRIGVVTGTSAAGLTYSLDQHYSFLKNGASGMDSFVTSIMNNGVATRAISMKYKLNGVSNTFTSTCVASTDAIGYSYNLIKEGRMDVMITGGAESCICLPTVTGFYLGRILSKKDNIKEPTPAPFDLNRDGTVIAEGAAILILENLDHALKRKASILAEIGGYGTTSDAYHVVKPEPSGKHGARAVKMALKDAGINASSVDYINAHGTATKRNDWAETKILKKVFSDEIYNIPISGTKSITGHALGAAGAFEAIISVLTIKNSIVPPTINYRTKDPKCDLDYVANTCRKKKVSVVLSNSFGFGGFNSVLIFKKFNG